MQGGGGVGGGVGGGEVELGGVQGGHVGLGGVGGQVGVRQGGPGGTGGHAGSGGHLSGSQLKFSDCIKNFEKKRKKKIENY